MPYHHCDYNGGRSIVGCGIIPLDRPTGRTCPKPGCGASLTDILLDWEDHLPHADLQRAEYHSKRCRGKGLALCLGTSMQMRPARDLPCQAAKMVIVNLQPTVRDKKAWLTLRAKTDDVMYGVMKALQLPIPVSRTYRCP